MLTLIRHRALAGAVDPSTAIEPVRRYCDRTSVEHVQFIEATCEHVDPAAHQLRWAEPELRGNRLWLCVEPTH